MAGAKATRDEATGDTAHALPLHLVSWNVHAVLGAPAVEARLEAVGDELLRRQPDVALFQEVWTGGWLEHLEDRLAPGYHAVRLPDEGWLRRPSGLVAFLAKDSDWRLADRGFTAFRDAAPTWKLWEGDGFGRKGVMHLRLRRGDATLHLLNTHLQAEYSLDLPYQMIRRRQLEQFLELGRTLEHGAAGAEPMLAAGDFNTDRLASEKRYPEGSRGELALYRQMLEEWRDLSGLACRPQRSSATSNHDPTRSCATQFVSEDTTGGWIDYVLWRRCDAWSLVDVQSELIRNHRRDEPFSDHQGFAVRLRMQPTTAAARRPSKPRLAALALALLAENPSLDRREMLAAAGLSTLPRWLRDA